MGLNYNTLYKHVYLQDVEMTAVLPILSFMKKICY